MFYPTGSGTLARNTAGSGQRRDVTAIRYGWLQYCNGRKGPCAAKKIPSSLWRRRAAFGRPRGGACPRRGKCRGTSLNSFRFPTAFHLPGANGGKGGEPPGYQAWVRVTRRFAIAVMSERTVASACSRPLQEVHVMRLLPGGHEDRRVAVPAAVCAGSHGRRAFGPAAAPGSGRKDRQRVFLSLMTGQPLATPVLTFCTIGGPSGGTLLQWWGLSGSAGSASDRLI